MKKYKTKEEAMSGLSDFIIRYIKALDAYDARKMGDLVEEYSKQVWDSAFEAGRKEPKNTTKT